MARPTDMPVSRPDPHPPVRHSRFPSALTLFYALCIIYASLYPFIRWEMPTPGTPYWLLNPGRFYATDFWVNAFAYSPLGLFAGFAFSRHAAFWTLLCGALLSFAMESCQWWMPPRSADLYDLLANTAGTLSGAVIAWSFRQWRAAGTRLAHWRRSFLDGNLGDVGLALVVFWLAAQSNPSIPLFSTITFSTDLPLTPAIAGLPPTLAAAGGDMPVIDQQLSQAIEVLIGAFQIAGIGLFAMLLLRRRRDAVWAVPALLGMAIVLKQVTALLTLHADALLRSVWRLPSLMVLAVGLLLLGILTKLSRPQATVLCSIILLASLLAPLLLPDFWSTHASLAMFNDRYAHLLHFNGLTHTILLGWPLAASGWLFFLAGRPQWGAPSQVQ